MKRTSNRIALVNALNKIGFNDLNDEEFTLARNLKAALDKNDSTELKPKTRAGKKDGTETTKEKKALVGEKGKGIVTSSSTPATTAPKVNDDEISL